MPNPHRPGWPPARDFVGELAARSGPAASPSAPIIPGGLDWTFRHEPIGTFGDLMACVPFEDDYRAYALAQYRELIEAL